ncbi:MAG: Rpn family recombination-promoting nuclease/putative transposase [Bacteroidota bacterium]
MAIVERYIDGPATRPFTDFGFKKLFGSEPNKELLIDFPNELLRGKKKVKNLTYAKNEQLGHTSDDRKALFDLYCEGEQGEKFIIELQRINQLFFKDRSVYYSTFPIQEQGPKGQDWNYRLPEIFMIGIMDFALNDTLPEQFHHEVKLIETSTKRVFYDKLTFVYLEMPKFEKDEQAVQTHYEKWLFLLKNLHRFTEIPAILQERIFRKVFNIAEVANLNEEDMKTYEASLKQRRDWQNAVEYATQEAEEKGMKRGMEKGMEKMRQKQREIALNLKKGGVSVDIIAESTGLSADEIDQL